MYFLLGITLFFAFLLVLNLVVSISASAIWRMIAKPARYLSSAGQEQVIFALRTFPVAAALIFVAAVLLPSYLLYEPAESGENISAKLAVISTLSLTGIFFAVFRVLRTTMRTRRLLKDWLRNSKRISIDGVDIPIYELTHSYPVLAVVGILRPKMFVATQVFETLSEKEFKAAVAHEHGHIAAHDNFKRSFLNVCRDMLILPIGEGLYKAWTNVSEAAADEYAVRKDSSTALDLASALLKIARIAPRNAFPAMPSGSFLVDDDDVDVTSRVRRLVDLSENPVVSGGYRIFLILNPGFVWCFSLFLIAFFPLLDHDFYPAAHHAIERFVHILQ